MGHASPPFGRRFFAGTLSDPSCATSEPVAVFQTLGRVFGTRAPGFVKNSGIV
jgi:hypothetical protein